MKKLEIGGQAVIEGVLMMSKRHLVVSVRKKKKIITKKERLKQRRLRLLKLPIVRGFLNLIRMLVIGIKSLM